MNNGKVYLVGAGPGDPGLLTVRGLELLRRAGVIVYDQLVNPVLLEEASSVAVKIFAGKQASRHCIAQTEINKMLIGYARLGHEVLRLKGGDPFVFGRGGEEVLLVLQVGAAGLARRVVREVVERLMVVLEERVRAAWIARDRDASPHAGVDVRVGAVRPGAPRPHGIRDRRGADQRRHQLLRAPGAL